MTDTNHVDLLMAKLENGSSIKRIIEIRNNYLPCQPLRDDWKKITQINVIELLGLINQNFKVNQSANVVTIQKIINGRGLKFKSS